MNTANSIKCIATLFKVAKLIKCVKKIEICVIVCVMILIGVATVADNKKGIEKTLKQLKKKVM